MEVAWEHARSASVWAQSRERLLKEEPEVVK